MARADKKKLPIGMIGNGSGNATMQALGIKDVNDGLDYIVAATCIKNDLYKVLIDHEKDEGIPEGRAGYNQRRYAIVSVLNCDFPTLMAEAIPFKKYFRNIAYALAFIKIQCCGDGLKDYQY